MVAEDENRGSQLAEAERLGVGREAVRRVERLGGDLARDLAHGQLVGVEGVLGPVADRLLEHGLVEDVVVAEEGVGAADAGVVLQDVVLVQHVEGEEGRVGLWVDDDGLLEHDRPQRLVEVDAVLEGLDDGVLRQVASVVREVPVVRQGVHHGARAADCDPKSLGIKNHKIIIKKTHNPEQYPLFGDTTYNHPDQLAPSRRSSPAEHGDGDGGWQKHKQLHKQCRES